MVPHFARVPLITKAGCVGALSTQVPSAEGFEFPPSRWSLTVLSVRCIGEFVCQPFWSFDDVVSFSFAECEGVLQTDIRLFVCLFLFAPRGKCSIQTCSFTVFLGGVRSGSS